MMNRRSFLGLVGRGTAALTLASAFGWAGHSLNAQSIETLNIAVLLNTAGESEISDGAQLAVDKINENGGIGGQIELALQFEDGRFNPVEAVNAANRIANSANTGFVLGPLLSSQALATQPVFSSAGIMQVYFGSAEEFTEQHEQAPLSLRYGMQTSMEMAPVAKHAIEVANQGDFYILAQNGDAGRSYATSLQNAIAQIGGNLVAEPEFYPPFNNDFAQLITRVVNSGANALLLGTGVPSEIIAAIDEYERQGQTPNQLGLYGNITMTNQSFFNEIGATGRADGFIFPYIFDDGTDPREFPLSAPPAQAVEMSNAFFERFGHFPVAEGQLTAWGWGGIQLIAQALEGLIESQGIDAINALDPVVELPLNVVDYILSGASEDNPGRIFNLTFGDLGFLSCGQGLIEAGLATYRGEDRTLLQDRGWANELVPSLC